jgi:hypothetical protein
MRKATVMAIFFFECLVAIPGNGQPVLISEDFENPASIDRWRDPGFFGTAIRLNNTQSHSGSTCLELFEQTASPFEYADNVYPVDSAWPLWEVHDKDEYSVSYWVKTPQTNGFIWRTMMHMKPHAVGSPVFPGGGTLDNSSVAVDFYELRQANNILSPTQGVVSIFSRYDETNNPTWADYYITRDGSTSTWKFQTTNPADMATYLNTSGWTQYKWEFHIGTTGEIRVYIGDMVTPKLVVSNPDHQIQPGTFSLITPYTALGSESFYIDDVEVVDLTSEPPPVSVLMIDEDFENPSSTDRWFDPGFFGTAIRLSNAQFHNGSTSLELYELTASPFEYADNVRPVDSAWPLWDLHDKDEYSVSFWVKTPQANGFIWRTMMHMKPHAVGSPVFPGGGSLDNSSVAVDYYELRQANNILSPTQGVVSMFSRYDETNNPAWADYYTTRDGNTSTWKFQTTIPVDTATYLNTAGWTQYKWEFRTGTAGEIRVYIGDMATPKLMVSNPDHQIQPGTFSLITPYTALSSESFFIDDIKVWDLNPSPSDVENWALY